MSWTQAVPVLMAGAAWLVIPGGLLGFLMGLRGLALLGMAPVLTTAVVATTAVAGGVAGVRWSVWLVLGSVVAIVVGLLLLRLWPRWRELTGVLPDPLGVTLAGLAGVLPAMLLGGLTVMPGMGPPDNLMQVYDGVFHYNVLAYIADSGQASSLGIGSLGNPGMPGIFYPAGWHDLGSLLMASTGASVPVAANALIVVIALVAWPLSCLLLVRQIAGPSRAALAVTGLVSLGFTAFPWSLFGWGVLWPNLLGLALLPAALAVLLSVTGLAREDVLGRARSWVLAPVVFAGIALAHPNTVFSLAVLSVFVIGTVLVRRFAVHREAGRVWRGALEVAGALGLGLLAWWWVATTPVFAAVRTYYWAPFETSAAAVGEVVVNSHTGREPLWWLSFLMLAGLVIAVRTAGLRWIAAAHIANGALFVLAASVNTPETQKFTGYWYNDAARIAAGSAVTAVPLAVLGIVFLAGWVRDQLPSRVREVAYARTAIAVVILLVVAWVSGGFSMAYRTKMVAFGYTEVLPQNVLIEPRTAAFFAGLRDRIPADAVVAGNPWDGSALIWPLADRRPLFPHFVGVYSADQDYLARNLNGAAGDPRVCETARRLNVQYLLIGGNRTYWNHGRQDFPGLVDPGFKAGLDLVATDGNSKLYRLSACQAK